MDYFEMLDKLWESIQDFHFSDIVPTVPDAATMHDMVVVTVTLGLIALINVLFLLFKPGRVRARMTKEERRLYERRIISDAITDAIEDKVYRGEISENTAQHWYFLIGHRCGLTDLFPKPPAKPAPPLAVDLKVAIRERLVNLWKTKQPLPKPAVVKPKSEKVLTFERRPAKSA